MEKFHREFGHGPTKKEKANSGCNTRLRLAEGWNFVELRVELKLVQTELLNYFLHRL